MKIRDVPQTGSVADTVTYQSRYGLVRRQKKVIPRDPSTRTIILPIQGQL